jgi:hypothetical protein
MRRLCSGFAKDLHDVVRIMEPLGCWRRFFRRDVDHVKPGRNSRHNAPSSVPTALSTVRLAASSLQHAPRRRNASCSAV